MGCKLEDDPLLYIIAGVARDRRAELGDAADLKRDPVFAAALVFVGLDHWCDEPDPEHRMEHARSIIDAMRPASVGEE